MSTQMAEAGKQRAGQLGAVNFVAGNFSLFSLFSAPTTGKTFSSHSSRPGFDLWTRSLEKVTPDEIQGRGEKAPVRILARRANYLFARTRVREIWRTFRAQNATLLCVIAFANNGFLYITRASPTA